MIAIGELPDRATVFIQNTGSTSITGYALRAANSGTVNANSWADCNLLDAKSYGLYSGNYNQPHNTMQPYLSVYMFRRKA